MGQKIINIIYGLAIIFLAILVLRSKPEPVMPEPQTIIKTPQYSGNQIIGHPFEGDPVIINSGQIINQP
ncbi:MAG TPA: hypothetical protein PLT32_00040 [bacterium]|nr:hypothetical protein [bacterium]